MKIADFDFAEGNHTFIIAELSCNHNQDFDIAIESIKAAKECGANAIKLQTFKPELITLDSNKEDFRIKQGTLWDGRTLFNLYQQVFTPWEWQPKLKAFAESIGLLCFSSPFDKTSVDFLENMDVPAYKVASFEITDIPLIEHIASKGKPVIISTGIAGMEDIALAVETCRRRGNEQIILLKCTSSYPAPIEDANLAMIPDLARRFGVIAGLSDHTMGITAPVVATTLGARLIEKHFILDRSIGGPDASFSLNKEEFAAMVHAVRQAEVAVGKIDYTLTPNMMKSREFSRSLYVVENIKAGMALTEQNIRSIRPGFGLHPKYYGDVLNKIARFDLEKGTALKWDDIS